MRLADVIRMRLRTLLSRSQVEQELDEELQYHLERQTEENIAAGMVRVEARLAALRSINGLTQRKEECRDMRGVNILDNLLRDLRFALRQLNKNLGFTFTAVLMLALGLGASVAIFAFVDAALLKPLPYRDPSTLVGVFESIPMFPRSNLSYPDYLDWKKLNVVFSSLDIYRSTRYLLITQVGTEPVSGVRVSDGFFRTLGVTPVLGRDFNPGEDLPKAPRTVLLSYAAWQQRYGGNANVLGQTVVLDNQPNVIIGVLPREFHFAPAGAVGFWTAFHAEGSCDLRRSCHPLYGVGRLKDGVSLQSALANVKAIAQQLETQYPDSNRGQGAAVATLTEVVVGDLRPILLVLLGGAGLLLLIAVVNVTGLLLVRAESRKREMAVRTALGASSRRLFGQFVTEALVLTGVASVLGLFSAQWAVQLLLKLIDKDIMDRVPFLEELGLNFRVAGFAAVVALGAVALFSLAPSVGVWSTAIRADLAEGSRGSAGTVWRRLGSKLVVIELAMAMILLVGAGLLGKSLYRLLHVDLGIQPEHLVTILVGAPQISYEKDEQQIALGRQIVNRLEKLPGVRSAAIASNGLPLTGNGNTTWFRVIGRPWHGEHNEAPERDVTAGYFTTIGAKLLRGRHFNEDEDASKPRVAIINQTFVKQYFPNEDPLGKQLTYLETRSKPIEIVGVVENIREGSLDADIPPVLYTPFNQNTDRSFAIVTRSTQSDPALLLAMTSAIKEIDPGIATMGGQTMTERINNSPSAYLHRSSAWLVGGFAALALLLGLVGLYGVVAYSVSQRTREIGVRMALGAQPRAVYQLIFKEAGWLIAVGIVLGLACSVGVATLMSGLLFGVRSWDIPTLAGVAAGLGVAALLASYFPARRAASVNPVVALRAE